MIQVKRTCACICLHKHHLPHTRHPPPQNTHHWRGVCCQQCIPAAPRSVPPTRHRAPHIPPHSPPPTPPHWLCRCAQQVEGGANIKCEGTEVHFCVCSGCELLMGSGVAAGWGGGCSGGGGGCGGGGGGCGGGRDVEYSGGVWCWYGGAHY